MTFSDKPEPGIDFIALLLLFNLGLLSLAGWQLVERDILDDPGDFIMFAVSCLFLLFPLAKTVRGSFDTEYRIEEDRLVLRQGKREETIQLASIVSVELIDSLWKTFGLNNFGFINRIGNFVIIKAGDKKYLLTPTHPQLFVSQIRGLLSQSPDYIETTSPAASSPQKQDSTA